MVMLMSSGQDIRKIYIYIYHYADTISYQGHHFLEKYNQEIKVHGYLTLCLIHSLGHNRHASAVLCVCMWEGRLDMLLVSWYKYVQVVLRC